MLVPVHQSTTLPVLLSGSRGSETRPRISSDNSRFHQIMSRVRSSFAKDDNADLARGSPLSLWPPCQKCSAGRNSRQHGGGLHVRIQFRASRGFGILALVASNPTSHRDSSTHCWYCDPCTPRLISYDSEAEARISVEISSNLRGEHRQPSA